MVARFRSYPESAGLCAGSPPRGRADRVLTGRGGVIKVQRTKPSTRVPRRAAWAVEWQWTLGQIVNAVAAAGLEILHLGEERWV